MASIFSKKSIFILLLSLTGLNQVGAQLLEQKPELTTYNLQSVAGVPISSEFGNPVGSNGSAPTDATPGQFSAYHSSGAVVAPSKSGFLDATKSFAENAENLDLPRSSDGSFALIGGASGAAVMSAQPSYMFGGIIPFPDSAKIDGIETPINNPHAFWYKEPYKPKYTIVAIHPIDKNNLNIIKVTTSEATTYESGDLVEVISASNPHWGGVGKAVDILTVAEDKKSFTFQVDPDSAATNQQAIFDGLDPDKEVVLTGDQYVKETHTSKGYHFSAGAQTVFAINAGTVKITWRESVGIVDQPDGSEKIDWIKIKKKYYRLHKKDYIVSSSSIKPAKKYYWNVDDTTQPTITLQNTNVEEIDVIYNSNFKRRLMPYDVADENSDYDLTKVPSTGPGTQFLTMWTQKNGGLTALRSHNVEGRVFVELLGAKNNEGNHKHLGFEIVDVYAAPVPENRTVYLGNQLYPFKDSKHLDSSLSLQFLTDEPSEHPQAFKHIFNGNIYYYAEKDKNFSSSDNNSSISEAVEDTESHLVKSYWVQTGMAGIKWPIIHVDYNFMWPEESSDYSHYSRPNLGESDSESTSVQLPIENSPIIVWEDDMVNNRSKINKENYKFTSWLGPDNVKIETYRTLIRYNSSSSGIRYERVFSWLDESINKSNLSFSAEDKIINTTQVRHFSIWPKITIDGNLNSQILHKTDDNTFEGSKGKVRQHFFTSLEDPGIGTVITAAKDIWGRESGENSKLVETINSVITSPENFDDYGAAIEGYFIPPVSGEYKFKIESMTESQLNVYFGNNSLSAFVSIKRNKDETVDVATNFLPLNIGQPYLIKAFLRKSTNDERLVIKYQMRGDDGFTSVSSGLIASGLRVKPLDQEFYTGDTVYFTDSINGASPLTFTFTSPAQTGDIIINGILNGLDENNGEINGLTGATFRDSIVANFNTRVEQDAPKYIETTALVGQRLEVPEGEYGSGDGNYWAGYIDSREGDLFPYHPTAYINPMVEDFTAANAGSIIPVNASPVNNIINVIWFRRSALDSDPASGFGVNYWPSVYVKYTIEYPANARKIILASNDGSGPLSSLEAKGDIYYQNYPDQVGYNPNEEHALMLGGQAYALRNDLNIYDINGEIRSELQDEKNIGDASLNDNSKFYSSAPFVLLEYIDSDGKLSISTFEVRSEIGEEGLAFDYVVEAGSLLQAPMPLALMPKPTYFKQGKEVVHGGQVEGFFNNPPGWDVVKNLSYFSLGATYKNTTGLIDDDIKPEVAAAASDPVNHFHNVDPTTGVGHSYQKFLFQDRKNNFWVYRGIHNPPSDFNIGNYNSDSHTKWTNILPTEAVSEVEFSLSVHSSRLESEVQLSVDGDMPAWMEIEGLTLLGTPTADDTTASGGGSITFVMDGDNPSANSATLITLNEENEKFAVGQSIIVTGVGNGDGNGNLNTEIISSFINEAGDQQLRIKDAATMHNNNVVQVKVFQVLAMSIKGTESREGLTANTDLFLRVRAKNEEAEDIFVEHKPHYVSYVKGEETVIPRGRPPYLSTVPTQDNSFQSEFFYFVKRGFAYPKDLLDGDYPQVKIYDQDDVDQKVFLPYLVEKAAYTETDIQDNIELGEYMGGNDSIYLGIKPKRIVYRPVWPKTTPVLDRGDTLTSAKYGLPAIRGQGTAEVIYQQSIAKGELPQDADGVTNITVTQNVDGNWIKVLNPDGEGYSAGDLNTVSFTIDNLNGYQAYNQITGEYIGDDYLELGINVDATTSAISSGTRFHFRGGSVFVTSQDHSVSATKIYGKLVGRGNLNDNEVGTAGGLTFASSTLDSFNLKTKAVLEVSAITGSWYFNNDSVGKIRFKSIPTDLEAGDVIVFSNGSKIVLHTNVNSSASPIDIIRGSYTIHSPHYVCFKAGFRGVVSSVSYNDLNLTIGQVFNFPNDSTFTINKLPKNGEISLSGTLSGDLPNGSESRIQTTLSVNSVELKASAGEAFYFPNGVFVLSDDVDGVVTQINGHLTIRGNQLPKDVVGLYGTEFIKKTESVKLIDPTREKVSYYVKMEGESFPPSSVNTSYYQGKIYFPSLPPHLAKRVYVDMNRGSDGALVLVGKFMDELVGEKYLQLNVLSESDYKKLIELCNSGDPGFTSWKTLVKGLKTRMENYVVKVGPDGNTPIKGVYEVDPSNSYDRNISEVAEVYSSDTAVDSYALSATGPGSGYVSIVVGNGLNENVQPIGEPVTIHIIRVSDKLHPGSIKVVTAENPLDERTTFFHSPDLAAKTDEYEYQWRKAYPVDGSYPDWSEKQRYIAADGSTIVYESDTGTTPISTPGDQWLIAEANSDGYGKNIFTLGEKPGIDTLMDLYLSMRYRKKGEQEVWSDWSKPQLAEGWIKRVLAGINPFNQRSKDLFNNQANLDYSMLTQAGKRWEGDVALSLSSINDFGLIEIYETVLNKAKNISINAGINHNGANQALLLAAGYLNDLYMMVGNDAYADAYNPTIGFSTSDGGEYGDFSTALFSFKGQLSTLLDEELALLRGRDDFMAPGVEANPVYNRLFWNYTRGIDSGEVIYALNYNIQEREGENLDGNVDAADAAHMYPMGHGDAFGHYMTAIKGYYKLLADTDFTWVPQSESVLILGQEVAVDYMDERKFAAAAAAIARTGNQVIDLTWRKDYKPGTDNGWEHWGELRENDRRTYKPINVVTDDDGNEIDEVNTIRSWSLDHWASRVGQGTYLNWMVANAIIPSVDDDPSHEGIQKVDRTTVVELSELPAIGKQVQITLDNAAAALNPLGLPENSVSFDIDPAFMEVGSGIQGETHFDQVYKRAVFSLDNAVAAFDSSKDVTQLMRIQEDSAAELATAVEEQELAYKYELIELYGTPYPEDVGPGKIYSQGYDGPDLLNFSYIDYPSLPRSTAQANDSVTDPLTLRVYIEKIFDVSTTNNELQDGLISSEIAKVRNANLSDAFTYKFSVIKSEGSSGLSEGTHYIDYELNDHGLLEKPSHYVGKRSSPGEIQSAAHAVVIAHCNIQNSIREMSDMKRKFDMQVSVFNSLVSTKASVVTLQTQADEKTKEALRVRFAADTAAAVIDPIIGQFDRLLAIMGESTPSKMIFGFSNGGDFLAPLKALVASPALIGVTIMEAVKAGINIGAGVNERDASINAMDVALQIFKEEGMIELEIALVELEDSLTSMRSKIDEIDALIADHDEAKRVYTAIVASGDRLLRERENFRKRSAAIVQGYRVRDAAFRIFRNEKLERYKSMMDLTSRYTYLAAKAFDYETGLLDTTQGKRFISRIVSSRALGVVDDDGAPLFAGSDSGDPGLSSVLAEMKDDWEVLRGRLGFNNPDMYGTTLSLRTENYRLLPNEIGDIEWTQVLQTGKTEDLLLDADVRRLCMQLDNGDGLPVPGIILNFSTTIQDGYNFFGKKLAAGDHTFSPTSFATKILGVGVALEGYEGIDYYDGDGEVVTPNPSINPNGLSATPHIYLIPVGLDSMRSPPLGDQSGIRTWKIQDATIPTPFNIGGSDFDSKMLFQSSDSLTELMFNVRKHQAFRPVSDASIFAEGPILPPSNIINNRLIGRSVWNSSWKLVIPGKALLYDANEGLDILIRTLKDIKIHFETYSFSGN